MADPKNSGGNGKETTAPAKVNRFAAMFDEPHFAVSESDQVYTNTDGTRSRKIATVLVPFKGGFAGIPGTVYARQPKNGKVVADVTFVGTRQSTAIKPITEEAKAELAEFRKMLGTKYAEWRKAQGASIGPRVSTGVEVDGISFDEQA